MRSRWLVDLSTLRMLACKKPVRRALPLPVILKFSSSVKHVVIEYEFDLDDYVKTNGDELYINMSLDQIYGDHKLEDDRKVGFEQEYKSHSVTTTMLELPEGYEASYIPENQS